MQALLEPNDALEPAGNYQYMVESLLGVFDLGLPIHIVRGRDSQENTEFSFLMKENTGLVPRLVHISDLDLVPDSSSATSYRLCCREEQVHQVFLSLFPDEFPFLSQDLLWHLARISVNDFRTILLVNDQRFLGILLQEVDDLVSKHKILTPEQGEILRAGIVPTILPGSHELQQLLSSNNLGQQKHQFILKAARQSRGEGHLIGDEMSVEKWKAVLREMQDPAIRADTPSYVLQPYVQQPRFDIVATKGETVHDCKIVGTYYTANGHFIGLGPWRSGNGKICNVYMGGCVLLMSVLAETPKSSI